MRKFIFLLTLLVSLTNLANAQDAIPETPAEKVFSEWLSSFNSGDAKQLIAFDARYNGDKYSLEQKLAFRRSTGGMVVLRVEKSEPYHIEVLWREAASDIVGEFKLDISDETPPRILNDTNRIVPVPADLMPKRQSQVAALSGMRMHIDHLANDDKFSGAVLVARNERILLERAWGKANRENGTNASVNTRFGIGSMGKMFTAVATLQLVEAGKLNLDAVIGDYLFDYPNKEVAQKVTIRNLLTHTGGTGDIFGPEFDRNRGSLKEHSDYIKLFGTRPLIEAPGKYKYSNYGFILLGAIIEKASGMSYYNYVDTKIFRPAGMLSTGSLPESVDVPGRAIGYTVQHGSVVSNAALLPYRGTSAGGGYSTVGDLFRFARALESGKLIAKKLLADAITKHDSVYGFGFELDGQGDTFVYGHSGSFPGMNGELRIFPTSGYVAIGLSNLDFPSVRRSLDYFIQRMPLK